ncbi:MAG TPA: hypothetical protein VFP85_21075 [Vicinamibacterales bacterium]|nr:hypothetical protein [Vicinamibacterales bacterium]
MAVVALISAFGAAWAFHTQEFQVFRYWDSDEYFLMAEQLAAGQPVTASLPYAYRPLTPWIVGSCCGTNIQTGFLAVNLAAGLLTAMLLVVWLRRFTSSAGVRVLVVAALMLHWLSPLRFSFYYPAYVDPVFHLLVVAALISGEWLRAAPSIGRGLLYCGLVVLGTLAREVMLIVPLCAALAAAIDRRARGWQAVALAAAAVVYLAVQWSVAPRSTDYSWLGAVSAQLSRKRPESLLLTWLLVFGPVLAVVVYDWRATLTFLKTRADFSALLVLCAVLAYVGGTDTERLIFWSAPIVGLLVAQSIERHRTLISSAMPAALLIAGQLLSTRVLWPIPDPGSAVLPLAATPGALSRLDAIVNRVFVIDDFHWNLWSYFGSRPFHLVQLGFYLAIATAVVFLMNRRAATLKLATP